jgi:flagellar assembly protein FliH
MIIKGAGVEPRTLVVPHSLPGVPVGGGTTGRTGAPAAPARPSTAQLLDTAQAELADTLAARDEAAAETQRLLEDARQEAERLLVAARAEAGQTVSRATAEAERLLGQAQVELGRARAEAERLLAEAQARLEEVGEIIPTASEARRLLEENTAAAAEIRASAEADRQQVYLEAKEQGTEAGLALGMEEGARLAREELLLQLETAHAVAAQALVDREELIAAAEPEVIRLAMDVARKLIAKEVETDPDVLKGLLTRAMLKAAGDGPIRLRLHPQAIERLGTYLDDVSSRFASRGVEVVPDMTVGDMGVIVDVRSGSVDARLETQLAKVERTLLSLTGE